MTDDDNWDLYADAVIECEIDGLRHPLRGPEAEPLPAAPPIFVLTAYNPMGEERAAELNVVAERELEQVLASEGITFWTAIGRSRDASWSEPGVAVVGLGRAEACELGVRCRQLAVYELTAADVHVVRCSDGEIVRTRARAE